MFLRTPPRLSYVSYTRTLCIINNNKIRPSTRLMGRGGLNPSALVSTSGLVTDFDRKQTGKKIKQHIVEECRQNTAKMHLERRGSFQSVMNVVSERFLRYSFRSFFETGIRKPSGRYRISSPTVRQRTAAVCTPAKHLRRWSARNFTTKYSSRRNYNTTTTTRPRSMFGIVSSGVVFGPPSGHGPGRAIRRERRGT